MSNYRRLISYIYAYEGGAKGKNIGYAKVEIRGTQCRIHVNVKKVYVGSSDIGVFLLAPEKELLLGKIFIRGGVGEFRMTISTENVEESGISIDQCYGLTVHDMESTWQSYTTIWEDAVAQTAELQLSDVTAEYVRSKESPQIPFEINERENESEKTIFSVSAEIQRGLEEEDAQVEKMAPWESSNLLKAAAVAETPDLTKPMEMIKQIMPMIFAQRQGQNAERKVLEETKEPEIQPLPEIQDPAELEELDRMEKAEGGKQGLWNQLGGKYAKVLAFEYDNGCEILSIKPQDIGILPREVWMYGNNSFLLHGYYNYRHLILAKLDNPKGMPRYLLGVPGHYFSNEKHMATMFGFPHFVLAKRQPKEDGRFGYWYTDIRL